MRQLISLFVDGGCVAANPSPYGGTWAWIGIDAGGKPVRQGSGIVQPADFGIKEISNNFSELFAALRALEAMPKGWAGTLFTDSLITKLRLIDGKKFSGIPQDLRLRVLELRRGGKFKVVQVKGHPTKEELAAGKIADGTLCSKWNCWADEECCRLAKTMVPY